MTIKKSKVNPDVVRKRMETLKGLINSGPQLMKFKKLGKLKDQCP